jgi:hypothetical protein
LILKKEFENQQQGISRGLKGIERRRSTNRRKESRKDVILYVSLLCSSKIYGSFQSISSPMPKPRLWYHLKRPRTLMGTESPGYVFVRSKNILTSTLRLKNSVNNNSQLHNNVLLQEYTYNHEK